MTNLSETARNPLRSSHKGQASNRQSADKCRPEYCFSDATHRRCPFPSQLGLTCLTTCKRGNPFIHVIARDQQPFWGLRPPDFNSSSHFSNPFNFHSPPQSSRYRRKPFPSYRNHAFIQKTADYLNTSPQPVRMGSKKTSRTMCVCVRGCSRRRRSPAL